MSEVSLTLSQLMGGVEGSALEQLLAERPNSVVEAVSVSNRHHHQNHPLAYVNIFGTNQVAVIDIKKGVIIAAIAVGNAPTGIDISPDQRYVYVANTGDATLSVIRTWDNTVIDTVLLNTQPFESISPAGVKVSPDGKFIYVANRGTSNISIVDAHSRKVINDILLPDGSHPLIIDIEPNRTLAYVTLLIAGQVAVVDLNVNLLVKLIDLGAGSGPTGISIARNKPLALVTRQSDSKLSAINTDLAEASPDLIGVANTPFGILFSPAADLAYVACPGENTVSIVDVFSHVEINNIAAGNTPTWLGLTANGKLLVVSDVFAGTVTIINTCNYEITATLNLGAILQLVAIKN